MQYGEFREESTATVIKPGELSESAFAVDANAPVKKLN